MIYKKLLLLTLISLNFNNSLLASEGCDYICESDGFDDIFMDDEPTIRRLGHYEALAILTAIKFPSALRCNVYNKTYPLAQRSIFSLPSMLLYHSEHVPGYDCYPNLFRFNIFFNQSTKLSFGSGCHLDEYLCFDNNPVFSLDENILDQIKNANIFGLLEVAKKGKVSERRVGAYLQYLHNFDCRWSFELDVPFYYQERNYYLDDDDIRKIELESKKAGLPDSGLSRKEQERMMTKYAVSDKVGFGDTVIRAGYWLNPECNFPLKLGLLLRLPTGATVKDEVLGTNFQRDMDNPSFNLFNIMCLAQQDPEAGGDANKALCMAKSLLLKVSNRLSSMLLDRPMGYDHLGIGFFADNYLLFNSNTALRWALNCEYLIPGKEVRYFSYKKVETDYDLTAYENIINNFDTDTATQAQKDELKRVFNFFDEQVIGTIIPQATCAKVHPGFIVQLTAGPQMNYHEWQLNLGYDYWYQQKEKISKIYRNKKNQYDICKGTRPSCYQFKFFGELRKNISNGDYSTSFGLHGEETFLAKGIGRDFNVALDFQFLF